MDKYAISEKRVLEWQSIFEEIKDNELKILVGCFGMLRTNPSLLYKQCQYIENRFKNVEQNEFLELTSNFKNSLYVVGGPCDEKGLKNEKHTESKIKEFMDRTYRKLAKIIMTNLNTNIKKYFSYLNSTDFKNDQRFVIIVCKTPDLVFSKLKKQTPDFFIPKKYFKKLVTDLLDFIFVEEIKNAEHFGSILSRLIFLGHSKIISKLFLKKLKKIHYENKCSNNEIFYEKICAVLLCNPSDYEKFLFDFVIMGSIEENQNLIYDFLRFAIKHDFCSENDKHDNKIRNLTIELMCYKIWSIFVINSCFVEFAFHFLSKAEPNILSAYSELPLDQYALSNIAQVWSNQFFIKTCPDEKDLFLTFALYRFISKFAISTVESLSESDVSTGKTQTGNFENVKNVKNVENVENVKNKINFDNSFSLESILLETKGDDDDNEKKDFVIGKNPELCEQLLDGIQERLESDNEIKRHCGLFIAETLSLVISPSNPVVFKELDSSMIKKYANIERHKKKNKNPKDLKVKVKDNDPTKNKGFKNLEPQENEKHYFNIEKHDRKLREEEAPPPCFLRDVCLYLSKSDSPSHLTSAFEAMPSLLSSTLADEELCDRSLMLELAQNLAILQDSFKIADFEKIRRETLVDLCIRDPKIIIPVFTERFCSQQLSIREKIDALNLLYTTAEKLSSLPIKSFGHSGEFKSVHVERDFDASSNHVVLKNFSSDFSLLSGKDIRLGLGINETNIIKSNKTESLRPIKKRESGLISSQVLFENKFDKFFTLFYNPLSNEFDKILKHKSTNQFLDNALLSRLLITLGGFLGFSSDTNNTILVSEKILEIFLSFAETCDINAKENFMYLSDGMKNSVFFVLAKFFEKDIESAEVMKRLKVEQCLLLYKWVEELRENSKNDNISVFVLARIRSSLIEKGILM